jgi:hypothetical protein
MALSLAQRILRASNVPKSDPNYSFFADDARAAADELPVRGQRPGSPGYGLRRLNEANQEGSRK